MVFKLQDALRHSKDFYDSCYFMGNIDEYVDEYVQDFKLND